MSDRVSQRVSGPADGHLWPTQEQEWLLRAALHDGAEALAAFQRWRELVDVEGDFGWQSQRLLPLAYDNLSRLGATDPLMTRMKGVYRRAWYENHQLFRRVAPVVQALADDGIKVVLLKGAALVLDYYRNHALRPMSDVDVLVSPGHAERAVAMLVRFGWHPTSVPSADRFRFFHALQFQHPDGGEIDLHWHVMYESCADGADAKLLAGALPLDFCGIAVRQLAPTALLLQLIVHGVRWNPETPIRWVPDAAHVLRTRSADIDWTRFVELAQALRLTARLSLGLQYLGGRIGIAIPADVITRLQATPVSPVERLENSVILRDTLHVQRRALGNQWVIAADFVRIVDPMHEPIRFAMMYPHFLRYRWGLSGRREILPMIARGLAKRVLGPRLAAVPAVDAP